MSKVTDALLAIASTAGAGRPGEALPQVDALRERHASAVRALVSGPAQTPLLAHVAGQFDQLADIVRALAVLREVSPRTLDVVAAMGELLSSRIVAAALTEAGVPADWVDARCAIVTDAEHTRATPLGPETNAALRRTVTPVLDAGRVAVLGGFVGATTDGHTSTLGRGGSDYSGALVGAGIDAREIQIWTDVDGMLSADPRVIDRAASDRAALVCRGRRAGIFRREGAAPEHDSAGGRAQHSGAHSQLVEAGRRWHADHGARTRGAELRRGTRLTGLASKRDVTVIDITSTRMLMAYGFLRRVFEVFERFRTAVDMVTTSEVSVSVTVDDHRQLDAIVQALSEFAEVSIERELALLCAVGDRLQDEPEIAARVVGVLEEVPLKMISQAASRRNITVVLRQADLPHAMQRLHEEFFA